MRILLESNIEYPDHYTPIDLFLQTPVSLLIDWLFLAKNSQIPDYNAMILSTCTPHHQSNARVVLAKHIQGDSIDFFSHYHSPKGKEIAHQKEVSILFYWHPLFKQVRAWGPCTPVSQEESQRYFATRSRTSQLGTWASRQSCELEKATVSKSWEEILRPWEKKFPTIVPPPPHWGGFSIKLREIEFWQGRKNRFNYRVLFKKSANSWLPGKILYP